MISNYYTLASLTSLLDSRLAHQRIQAIFTQDRGQIVINVESVGCLIISCQPGQNALYLHQRFMRAKKNTVDLFPSCHGKVIRQVTIHPSDRIVTIALDSGAQLEASFFGGSANVGLLAPDGSLVSSFKRRKEPTTPSEMPAGEPSVGKDSDPQDATVPTFLKRAYPLLGPLLVREAMKRASISGTLRYGTLTGEQKESLESSIREILNDLGSPRPRIYFPEKGEPEFSIIPLQQFSGVREERSEDLNDAIRTFIGKTYSTKSIENHQHRLEKQLKTMLEKAARTSEAMEADRNLSQRSDEYEQFGKLLLSSLTEIKPGMESITLTANGTPVTIPLQRDLTPTANAQRYFDKSKRSRTARKQADERLISVRERVTLLRSLLTDLASTPDPNEFLKTRSKDLEELGLAEKQAAAASLPFRIYHVEGGFEVWAGKNSKSNDELTMKHARPNDLWFHARGAGGSHVVLRVNSAKGEPGKRARTQAASIAAYFSKMKGARMVPVAMTHKKYVRKPKGAPAGTVVIEREEVIIAEPRLPEG